MMRLNNMKDNKKAQEEMVGFGLILILVAIVFIVFISVYIRKPSESVTDYQSTSFVQSILQYTTTCQEENMKNLSIQELISKCQSGNKCYYRNMEPCGLLKNTIKLITQESWNVGPKNPVKGYSFIINASAAENVPETQLLNITNGVVTNNYKGAEQDFGDPSGGNVIILFDAYS
jgi:hypothetical protein